MNNVGGTVPEQDPTEMWIDPKTDWKANEGSVLLAEHIRFYVNQHGLLIEKKDFDEKNLKGASYALTPDPDGGWFIDDAGIIQDLKVRNSGGHKVFFVPKNSLVYIRIKEKLRLPYYIIGRHNLKISYVYQGLLLGTGPQVDPGFNEHLIIPLHNLTNQDVEILHDESFISIDFVRTANIVLDKGTPTTEVEFVKLYENDKRVRAKKINERRTLHDYLGGKKPTSSMGHLVPMVEELEKSINDKKKEIDKAVQDNQQKVEISLKEEEQKIERRSTVDRLAALALIVTFLSSVLGLAYHLDSKIGKVDDKISGAPALLQKIDELDKKLENSNKIEMELEALKKRLDSITSVRNTIDNKVDVSKDISNQNSGKQLPVKSLAGGTP